jgi:hypothetical protein
MVSSLRSKKTAKHAPVLSAFAPQQLITDEHSRNAFACFAVPPETSRRKGFRWEEVWSGDVVGNDEKEFGTRVREKSAMDMQSI